MDLCDRYFHVFLCFTVSSLICLCIIWFSWDLSLVVTLQPWANYPNYKLIGLMSCFWWYINIGFLFSPLLVPYLLILGRYCQPHCRGHLTFYISKASFWCVFYISAPYGWIILPLALNISSYTSVRDTFDEDITIVYVHYYWRFQSGLSSGPCKWLAAQRFVHCESTILLFYCWQSNSFFIPFS